MVHITQTLIGSWQYMFECREECQEEAREDFLKTLNREPKEPSEAMQKGLEFESIAYQIARGIDGDYNPAMVEGAKLVADIIKGAQIQVPAKRQIDVYGMELLVTGVLDALRAGTIFDVKFSSKSFGSTELAGKYLNSPQHPTYFYLVPEARDFVYTVSDGVDLYMERYTPKMSKPFAEICTEFLKSIDEMGLMPVFLEKWEV